MEIVTQYLEANNITLSDSDIKRLYDIVKSRLIIPGQNITKATVHQLFFSDCIQSGNTNNIENPVTCLICKDTRPGKVYNEKKHIEYHWKHQPNLFIQAANELNDERIGEAIRKRMRNTGGQVKRLCSTTTSLNSEGNNSQFFRPTQLTDESVLLYFIDSNISFRSAESLPFMGMMHELNINFHCPDSKKLATETLLNCKRKTINYVINSLKGKCVTMAINDTSSKQGAFLSIVLISEGSTSDSPLRFFFWDCIQLEEALTAKLVYEHVKETINKLKDYNIHVVSYTMDNCSVMKKSEKLLKKQFPNLKRGLCASHMLNNTFKDIIHLENVDTIWSIVKAANGILNSSRILRDKIYLCQQEAHFRELINPYSWKLRYLKNYRGVEKDQMDLSLSFSYDDSVMEEEGLNGVFLMDDDSSDYDNDIVYDSNSDEDDDSVQQMETEEEKEKVDDEVDEEDTDDNEEEVCLLDIVNESENEEEKCSSNEEEHLTTGNMEIPKPHHLVTFCTTRWYSAWLVMKRFYEVLPAIRKVVTDLERGSYSFLSSASKDKLLAVNNIDDDELKKVVYMLWPIVEAIDYLQSNSSPQVDVFPVLSSLISDYSEGMIELPSGVNSDDLIFILNKRIEPFGNVPVALRKLFFDEFKRDHPVIDSSIEEVEQFFDQVETELYALCEDPDVKKKKEYASKGRNQTILFLNEKDVGVDCNEYFETRKHKFSVLNDAYKKLVCVPFSNAEVERSFSIQGIIQSASRSRLHPTIVNRLLIIHANLAFMKNTPYYNHFTRYLKIADGLSQASTNYYFNNPYMY